MDNNRTSIIIIAVLAIAFLIALYERLGQGIPQTLPGDSSGGMIVALIAGGILAVWFGSGIFRRSEDRTATIRSMLIWGGIILVVVLILSVFGIPGITTTNTGVSI